VRVVNCYNACTACQLMLVNHNWNVTVSTKSTKQCVTYLSTSRFQLLLFLPSCCIAFLVSASATSALSAQPETNSRAFCATSARGCCCSVMTADVKLLHCASSIRPTCSTSRTWQACMGTKQCRSVRVAGEEVSVAA
jgi:hypothetical protein